jgi:Gly-Xaa carboxypeptidase
LIEKGFSPTREVVLSFGFDEEASGVYGAHENAKALTNIYGENSFALILDEGGGLAELYGGIL